jgi:hypothetical protein
VLTLFVGFFWYCKDRYGRKQPSRDTIEDHIRHADTYYWFGMAGRGSIAAINSGQKQIASARAKFDQGPALERKRLAGELEKLQANQPDETGAIEELTSQIAAIDELDKRIAGSDQDLKYQRVLHHDTFHGVFPWSHFMAKPTLFQDPRSSGTFELNDQPEVIASRSAVHDLVEKVLAAQTVTAQHDVVFVTDPADFPSEGRDDPDGERLSTQLENEALYLFNLDARFFVHNMLEVAGSLNLEEQQLLRELCPTSEMLAKLRADWGHRDILVVRVKKFDEVNNHHFFSAQGRLYAGTDPEPALVFNNYGFCRDRTFMLPAVIVLNALMLIAAVTVFRIFAHVAAHDARPPSWGTSIGLGLIGFAWGRVAVWGLAEVVEGFVPADENLAYLAFWWPVLTGFVILLGPALIMRFAEERFGLLGKNFSLFNRRGALFAAVAMGSTAYVAQAALWVRCWGGWPLIPPLILATICAAWILGRSLDETDSVKGKWGVAVAILALAIGLAFSNAFPSSLHHWKLWMVAAPMLMTAALAVHRSGRLVRVDKSNREEGTTASRPADSIPELIRLAQDPPFRTTDSFQQVQERLADWIEGRTVRLQAVGPPGVGKTALLSALCRSLLSEHDVSVMMGTCHEPHEGSVPEPYRPFAEAIADHFSINLLMPPVGQMVGIDKAVDGIFEEVVPFSDILFPPSGGEGTSGSKKELFHSISAMLGHLARKKPVLLIIDDAHWIDSGSRELLKFLLEEFPAGADVPVAIMLASRSPETGFSSDETVSLEPLSSDEIRDLLIEGLTFSPQAAGELAEAVGDEQGNLHWLFQMVTHLAGQQILQSGDDGWSWEAGTKLGEHLPDDLRQSVLSALDANPEFREVLEFAACIGQEFTIDVLSPAVGMRRLECIRLLDRIEAETGFIRDLHDRDDTFAFRSSFMLEMIRNVLGVTASGPQEPSPQRIREYHSALAGAWEKTLERSTSGLFRLATHRYAAGTRHAERAVQDVMNAAWASANQFQHDQSRRYLAMARECAAVAGLSGEDLERELLLIECHEAHVEGQDRVPMAERALAYLGDHPDADFDVCRAVAQACYDAGVDTRDQKHFANCVEVAKRMVERHDDPAEQAESHLFWAIALPLDQSEERRSQFEFTRVFLDNDDTDVKALRLKSRIANALAEDLSYGPHADPPEARNLFELSIQLKSREDIRDIEGLAVAHGGLGRLAFFAQEPDYDTAREHFLEDLRCSERIGSVTGQTKMHSLLGACDLAQGDDPERFQSARKHYEAAFELSAERFDKFFALAGLLESHAGLGEEEQINEHGEALRDLAVAGLDALPDSERSENPIACIPRPCLDNIRTALSRAEAAREAAWHQWLTELIEHNRVTDIKSAKTE